MQLYNVNFGKFYEKVSVRVVCAVIFNSSLPAQGQMWKRRKR